MFETYGYLSRLNAESRGASAKCTLSLFPERVRAPTRPTTGRRVESSFSRSTKRRRAEPTSYCRILQRPEGSFIPLHFPLFLPNPYSLRSLGSAFHLFLLPPLFLSLLSFDLPATPLFSTVDGRNVRTPAYTSPLLSTTFYY